jgi:cysteine desulfurase
METLRNKLHHNLKTGIGPDRVKLNGHPEQRLPNTLNVSIDGIIGETLLQQLPEIAASTGSACHAGSTEPSSVLLALGLSQQRALAALRLSLGRWTAETDVHHASQLITQKVKEIT